MIVEATAPVRIDLAGGTLDLYPLYLFLEGAVTVNMAIDLTTNVRIEPRTDKRIHITTLETGQTVSAEKREELPFTGPLGFLCRAVRHFHKKGGINITTKTIIPRGSGLGTSSSLLVALASALNKYNEVEMDKDDLVDQIAELEAQAIGVPTGKQDYYAAICGGVNAIHFAVGKRRIYPLLKDPAFIEQVENNCILTFTGESHQSAIANWNMLKAYVENTGDTRTRMKEIKTIAECMVPSVRLHDLMAISALLGQEWEARKRLAEGISTPQTEALIHAAEEAGAHASKICGAGGGGCMITIAPPWRRKAVVSALERAGAKELPFRISRQGVRVVKKG